MTGQVNTKAQQLDRARNHKLVLSKLDLGERQVKLVGSIAIVTSMAEVEGTNDGVPVKGTFRYTRVYQRLASGEWKITSFEATRVPSRDTLHSGHDAEPKTAKVPPPN
jgi:ketosteroid isomerase-like protein